MNHEAISLRRFIDDALFHPAWGYYATGAVRFGLGGHYDTYPLALSPVFGHMLAAQAFRAWQRAGEPRRFELCEVGAGNGQLCLDVLGWASHNAPSRGRRARFASALSYRILERSPALIARQRRTLGGLERRVSWSRGDLVRRAPAGAPFARAGLVFGNEVLDCFAPERVVPSRRHGPRVTFVEARLGRRRLGRDALARAMAAAHTRARVRFREVLRPLAALPALEAFLHRHCPEILRPRPAGVPYLACPQVEPFLRHAARLYDRAEAILIDYGDTRRFHLTAPERRRLFAGPPRSGATIYRAPGGDDITVMVDFSLVQSAARQAGWRIVRYGPQALLARGTGVSLGNDAVERIVNARALGWLLGALGTDPESGWRGGALTWAGDRRRSRRTLIDDARRDLDEFHGRGRTRTPFRLLHLRR